MFGPCRIIGDGKVYAKTPTRFHDPPCPAACPCLLPCDHSQNPFTPSLASGRPSLRDVLFSIRPALVMIRSTSNLVQRFVLRTGTCQNHGHSCDRPVGRHIHMRVSAWCASTCDVALGISAAYQGAAICKCLPLQIVCECARYLRAIRAGFELHALVHRCPSCSGAGAASDWYC